MNIVTRAQWGAQPPRAPASRMRLPVSKLFLHHTVSPVTSDRYADVRLIQKIAFSRKFSDISYSYLVDVDGNVYEGRGLSIGAHTAGLNSSSFGVALIGNYETRVVTDAQVDAVRQLVKWLIDANALNPGLYPTGGHRDAPGASTACPGEYAMRRLVEMRAPWMGIPPPPPAPAHVTDFPGEDAVHRIDIEIGLDDRGRGHLATPLPVPADRVVSMVVRGPYPPADGYWEIPVLSRQMRDGGTMVVATEGPPGQVVAVSVWVAD